MIKMRKAQTALEYLMTYGWAILIIVIVGAALYALGVFSPGTFAAGKACLGFSTLTYLDHGFKVTSNEIQISLGSSKDAVNITSIKLADKDGNLIVDTTSVSPEVKIAANGQGTATESVSWSGTEPTEGATYSQVKLTIGYRIESTGATHTDYATCNGKWE